MDSSPHEPERLSALYQYHNAPEVAPAHGLEYDDTIYPSSDKYPVIRETVFDGKLGGGKYGFGGDNNKPPRIIFGMKVRTFLLVASVMALVIVGAAVGGAVGGQQLRENQDQVQSMYTNSTNSATVHPSATISGASPSTSTFSAATPTYSPLSDCPASNNTTYTSSFFANKSSSKPAAGLHFTKFCDLFSPLNAQRIAEAYVYTFSDCVEVCAGYNFWNDGSNCTLAVYQPDGARPGNCWVGHAEGVKASALNETQGTDVAILIAAR